MKVRYNLKDSGGLILLKFRYLKGGLPFVFSTRQHVNPKDWNKKTMRAIVRNAAREPHLSDLNSLLQRIEDLTLSVYRENVGRVKLTHDLFRDRLNAEFFGQSAEQWTVVSFLREEMMRLKRSEETIQNYRHAANTLEAFQKSRGGGIGFDDIDFRWLAAFKSWAFEKEYATATVGKFVAIVKAAVNLARKRQLTDNRHVIERGFSVKVTSGNRKKLALYPHEVDAIAAMDWQKLGGMDGMGADRLEKSATVIVAACCTGLRHSDFHKVDRKSVVTFRNYEMIQVWTQKSDKPVAIPLDARLKAILERFDYQLPRVDRSELLKVGRVVLKAAGIDREVSVRDTKGGKSIIVHAPMYKKFSAHVTRRTFARNAYLEDPTLLPAIQAILGHATQAQTLEYIDIEDMLTAERFAKRMEMRGPQLKAVK